jgi:regulatory protein
VAWTDELAAKAARLERVNAAKAIAMKRLAARARSRAEMLEWLGTKGVESDIATEAVDRLAEIGLISDGQVEEDERRRASAKGLSARALNERLASRGIGAGAEGEAASGAQSNGDAARALEIARAELLRRPINPADVNVLARRVMGNLARKGYEEDVAREAIAAAFAEHGLRVGIAIESAE